MSNRLVVLIALCVAVSSQADAKPKGAQLAAATGGVLYEQQLPIQIVFIGVKPGVACPANPTFNPWLDLAVTAPCTTATDSFSPLDVDEEMLERMLPSRIRPAIGSASNRVAMAVVPEYRISYAQNAFAAGLARHLFGDGGIGTRLPSPAFAHFFYNIVNNRRIGRIDPSIVPAIDESYVVDAVQAEQYLVANIGAMGTTDRSGAPTTIDPRYPTYFIINLFGQPDFKFHDYVTNGEALVAHGGSAGGRTAFLDVSAGPEFIAESWSIDVCADTNGDGIPDQASSNPADGACYVRSVNGLVGNAAHLVPVWEYFNPNPLATPSMNTLVFEPHVFVDPALGYFRSRFTVDLAMYLRFVYVNIHSVGLAAFDPMDNVLPYNRAVAGGPKNFYPTDFAALKRFEIQRTVVSDPNLPAVQNTAPLLMSRLQTLEPRDYAVATSGQPLQGELSSVYECRNTFYNQFPGTSCYSPTSNAKFDTQVYVHAHEPQFMGSPNVANLPLLDFTIDPARSGRTLPPILGVVYFDQQRAGIGHGEVILAWYEDWLRPLVTLHEVGHAFGLSHPYEGVDEDGFRYSGLTPGWRFARIGQGVDSVMNELFDSTVYSPFDKATHRRMMIARLIEHVAFLDAAIRASNRADEVASALASADAYRATAIADADGLDGLDAAYRGYFALLVAAQQIHAEPPASAWPGSQKPVGMQSATIDERGHRGEFGTQIDSPPELVIDQPEPAVDAGGCNAGGGMTLAPMLAALALLFRRRRRYAALLFASTLGCTQPDETVSETVQEIGSNLYSQSGLGGFGPEGVSWPATASEGNSCFLSSLSGALSAGGVYIINSTDVAGGLGWYWNAWTHSNYAIGAGAVCLNTDTNLTGFFSFIAGPMAEWTYMGPSTGTRRCFLAWVNGGFTNDADWARVYRANDSWWLRTADSYGGIVKARCVDVATEWTGGVNGEVFVDGGPWGAFKNLASGPGWACGLTGIGGKFDQNNSNGVEITYDAGQMQWKLTAKSFKKAWARCVK